MSPTRIEASRGRGLSAGAAVNVELSSDMLEVPGEAISAGAKREQEWREFSKRRTATDARIAELDRERTSGTLSDERQATLSTVRVPSGVRFFFDHGGAVAPNATYLVALSPIELHGDRYVLHARSFIRWGNERDTLLAALDELTRN